MSHSATGILLANLGTPDAPTSAALRRYLKEFLWDPRVVDFPRPLWWLILNGVILNIRPPRSAKLYQTIWTEEGSPLLAIGRRQSEEVRQALHQRGLQVEVELAMRYGNPSIARGLEALREKGCERLLVLPLYPQYAAATTASTFDAVAQVFENWRDLPELRFVRDYHVHPGYVGSLANSIREYWDKEGEPEKLLISFHGIPQRYADLGDPYPDECHETARALAEQLGLPDERWQLTFQSRFGREPWLQPYTDKTLEAWGKEGLASVDVVCPGFSADCLETLEEIAITNRELFEESGGGRYRYIPALNDRADHIEALADIAAAQIDGWT